MSLDKSYIRSIRAALAKRGMAEADKCAIVEMATDSRTGHISEMTTTEAIGLLKALNGQADTYVPGKKDKMKRKILAYAHEMGWELPTGKVDMARVNGYCETRGYLKKPFNSYTVKELPRLVAQFKQMRGVYLKK